MVKTVNVSEALGMDCVFVDTRSPAEFKEACIPGAVNLPIFSNEERAVVGTLYKQVSKDKAMEKGLEMFLPKTKEMIKTIEGFSKPVVVYCWRGGMRSKGVVSLFEGREVYQLEGGHKAYRRYVREKLGDFSLKFKVVLLCGLTGSGKTRMLSKFKNSLDLEGLANHRGSLFGGVGLVRRSQKMFEALLLQELERLNSYDYVLVEGESRKVGDLLIPGFLFKAMRDGLKVFLDVPMDERVKIIVSEYCKDNLGEVKDILSSMGKRLGKQNVIDLCNMIDNDELTSVVRFLLERYYDPLYSHTMKDFVFDVKVRDFEGLNGYLNSCFGC